METISSFWDFETVAKAPVAWEPDQREVIGALRLWAGGFPGRAFSLRQGVGASLEAYLGLRMDDQQAGVDLETSCRFFGLVPLASTRPISTAWRQVLMLGCAAAPTGFVQ